jgi:hypothetical protein
VQEFKTMSLDFANAKLKHLRWKTKMRSFLDGKEEIKDSELLSEKDCELGKWLYAEGLLKYGNVPELKELENTHKQMHATVRRTAHAKRLGNTTVAEQEFEKLLAQSEKIIALLNQVQTKVA